MTYNECVNFFKNIALGANPTATFIHGKKADSSLISTSTVYPIIWLAPFSETTDRIKGNITRQITIAFFGQDSTNFTLDERQALIQTMWELKETFMSLIESQLPVLGVSINERATPEYYMLGGYVSGYSVTFQFQSKLPC